MKVAIVAPYPVYPFRNELGCLDVSPTEHPCTWIVNLIKGLSRNFEDMDIHLVTLSNKIKKDKDFELNGISFHFLKAFRFRYRVLTLFRRDKKKIHKKLREISPDIVHGHGTEDVYSYAAVTSPYPHIISIQGIMDEIAKVYPENRRIKIMRYLEKYTLRKARYIAYKSSFAKDVTKRFTSGKYFYLDNITEKLFFKIENKEINNQILFVGSILKSKGIEDLLQAILNLKDRHRRIKLTIIGDGEKEYMDKILRYINNGGLKENIELLGFKGREEVANVLSKSCMLVLPSHMDTAPNVIREAMAVGIPVVATKVGGIPDMVEDGKTGFLVNCKDVNSLADRISILLRDKELRRRMGQEAKKLAEARYTAEICAGKTKKVYEQILKEWKY